MSTVPEDFLSVVDLYFDAMSRWVSIISAQWILQVLLFIALIGFVISSVKGGSSDKKGGK